VGRGFGGDGSGKRVRSVSCSVASLGRVCRPEEKAPEFTRGSAWED